MSNCVVFFLCEAAQYPITKDVSGFCHTPYSFSSVDDAEIAVNAITDTCTGAFLISKPVSPEFRVSNIMNILKNLEVTNLRFRGTSYRDRDFLSINFQENTLKEERKLVVGTLMMLNSKGYLGDSQTYRSSSRNILTVI